eukprot:6178744-Pleurochrysis_carterae.AAC.4
MEDGGRFRSSLEDADDVARKCHTPGFDGDGGDILFELLVAPGAGARFAMQGKDEHVNMSTHAAPAELCMRSPACGGCSSISACSARRARKLPSLRQAQAWRSRWTPLLIS